MDEPPAAGIGADAPVAPRRAGRSPRLDREHAPSARAVVGAVGRPLALTATPLVASRSLGPLLGIGALSFKLESVQPTGSWLDRAAAGILGEATDGQRGVMGVVGAGPLTHAVAAQCARVGRQLMVLVPAADAGACAWLEALGARVVVVDADDSALRGAATALLATMGGQYVDPGDPALQAALRDFRRQVLTECDPNPLVALPSLTGHEASWLAEAAREGQAAVPLPLDGMDDDDERRILGIVGAEGEAFGQSSHSDGIVQQPVSMQEALAAQRLLAREEGIIASARGAAGLAGLIRVVQEDRRAPLRVRRLPRELSAVVVVTRELSDTGGPSLAPGELLRRTVSLAEVQANLSQWLVEVGI